MPTNSSAVQQDITSVSDLAVGDGIYSDQSETAYWVVEKSRTKVVLKDVDGRRFTWLRQTLDASFSAHDWIRQTESRKKFQ